MAIGANAVWECRTTGNNGNGGFYVSGGVDYSQQDTAQLTVTDCVTNGTTTVTSATGGFTSAMIGNGINVNGIIRQITAVGSSTSITVDASITAGSGQTARVGGALISPSVAMANVASGNKIYVKAGTYSITTSSTNVAGGFILFPSTLNNIQIIGYDTNRGDLSPANRPTLSVAAGLTSGNVIAIGPQNGQTVSNVVITGGGGTLIGINCTGGRSARVTRCRVALGHSGTMIQANGQSWLIVEECETTGHMSHTALAVRCSAGSYGSGNASATYIGCVSTNAAGTFSLDPGSLAVGCVAINVMQLTRSTLARACYAQTLNTQIGGFGGSERFMQCVSPNALPAQNGFSPQQDWTPIQTEAFTQAAEAVFVNPSTKDYRLTTYGKSLPIMRWIAAGLIGVPGITTDTLADLVAGAASPAMGARRLEVR